jgi:predicted permease
MLDRIRYAFRAVFRRSALEREMHDEMQNHLEQRTAAFVASGMNQGDARLAARREFGNVAAHQETGRDARPARLVHSIIADVHFALRYFKRKPLASATIVLVLAFGIGGHAFEMSLMVGVLTRRAPGIPSDVPIVRIRGMERPSDSPEWSGSRLSYVAVREIQQLTGTFESIGASASSDVVTNVGKDAEGEATLVNFVNDEFFPVLGLRVDGGSGLPKGVREPALFAVISHAMWEDAFDRGEVANREITVNGLAVRVVGVAPPRFGGVGGSERRRIIWMPVASRASILREFGASPVALSSPDSLLFETAGRLAPGVSTEQATTAVHEVARRVAARMAPPVAKPRMAGTIYDADVVQMRGITEIGSDMPFITAVWGVVSLLILLIACANVSSLVVSAAVARRQEIAVRLSLGASRRRVVRQLVTESTLLALAGGALGLTMYWAVIRSLSAIPEADFVSPSLATVGLTMLVALATGILFGLTPAFHATRAGVAEVLKSTTQGATRRSRLQARFVIAQIALTQPLLMVFGWLVGGQLLERQVVLPNGVAEHVMLLRSDWRSIPGTDQQRGAQLDRLEHALRATPGVLGVVPNDQFELATRLTVRDGDSSAAARTIPASIYSIREGYFALLGAPLLRGSDAAPSDSSNSVIISSTLARELWGVADPIGRRFAQVIPGNSANAEQRPDFIVGGVYDARYIAIGTNNARIFRPRRAWWNDEILIRTSGPALDLKKSIRRVGHEALPTAPLDASTTLAQLEAADRKEMRNVWLVAMGSLSLVLLLTSIGLYGVVALAVEQRRREIGVRLALGARAGQVIRMFCTDGLRIGIVSLAIGLSLSFAGVFILRSNTVRPPGTTEPSLWAVAAFMVVLVLVVTLVATFLPARRVSTVDPMLALRSE